MIILNTNSDELIIPAKVDGYEIKTVGGEYEEIIENPNYGDQDKGKHAWLSSKKQKFRKIVVSEGIEEIKSEAFRGVIAKEFVLPKSLQVIRDCAFVNTKTDKVVIKGKETVLEWCAFAGSSMKEITFPNDFCGEIQYECFKETNLKYFNWPKYKNKNKMGDYAFGNCKKLKRVTFPENQKEIYISRNLFLGCSTLKKLEFPASTGKVIFESSPFADNYKNGVGELIFKGKKTKVVGCEYKRKGDYNFITVGKITAPKNSAAIKYAKKSLKIGYLSEWLQEHASYGDTLENYSIKHGGNGDGIKLVPMEWEEI